MVNRLGHPGAPARDTGESVSDLVVEVPAHLPYLTPGLARALLAAITSAAVNVGLLEGADDEAAERLAS